MMKYQLTLSLKIQDILHVGANTAYFIYATLIVLPLVLIVSFVSYSYLEKPFLKFRNHKQQQLQSVQAIPDKKKEGVYM